MSWLISIWNALVSFFYVDVYIGKKRFIEYGEYIEMKNTIFNNSNGVIRIIEFNSKYKVYEHSIIVNLDNENNNDIFEVKYPSFIGENIQPKHSKDICILFKNTKEVKNAKISIRRTKYLRNYPLYRLIIK